MGARRAAHPRPFVAQTKRNPRCSLRSYGDTLPGESTVARAAKSSSADTMAVPKLWHRGRPALVPIDGANRCPPRHSGRYPRGTRCRSDCGDDTEVCRQDSASAPPQRLLSPAGRPSKLALGTRRLPQGPIRPCGHRRSGASGRAGAFAVRVFRAARHSDGAAATQAGAGTLRSGGEALREQPSGYRAITAIYQG